MTKDMCHLISEILQEESYEVNISYNGEDALSKIKENSYDLVILDYKSFWNFWISGTRKSSPNKTFNKSDNDFCFWK